MKASVLKNLKIFTTLCGRKAMPNIIMATTKWGEVKMAVGERREVELKGDFWKGLIADGCRTERFEDTHKSAWSIIGSLAEKDRVPVLLSHEIVDTHLRLNETQVGITLNKELEKLIKAQKEVSRRLRELGNNQTDELLVQELNKQQAEIEGRIGQTAGQLREMKISFTRRVRLFFKSRD
jgi:hypothetical protein